MACECDDPGWCSRHLVDKEEHWHKLCKTREDYFNLWEMGAGPGQSVLTDEDKENIKNRIRIEAPNIIRKAWNFGKAITNFISNDGAKVSQEEYENRLEQCDQCLFRDGNKCLHKSCGCFLTKKAQFSSESCPLGRWPEQDG